MWEVHFDMQQKTLKYSEILQRSKILETIENEWKKLNK